MGHIIKCQREPLPENLPGELVEFFAKAFHRKRSRRFQTARAMRSALQKAVNPEARFEIKIEELTLQLSDLQFKILESQNNANLLYKMVAEERIKSQQLTAAQQEAEKKSAAEKERVQKLRDEIGTLQNELHNLHELLGESTAENVKLKKHLRAVRRQFMQPQSKKNGARYLLPVPLEQAFFDAGNDFLNK